jgi:hypothetical protein
LNAENGTKIWDYATGEWVESSPAVINGKVYIGSDDNKMYCLNAENGTKIWDYTTDHFVCSSPAVADGKVYIGSVDNKVYCLNAENGTKIWDYTTGDSVFSSPAVADGKVYVGSWDGKIYCFGSQYPPPITGPSWGLVNVNYTFCINVTDTDGDDIYCIWNWGDGNTTDWLGPYSSGGTICASHTWSQKGTYGIRVKLKDVYGQESNWSDPHIFNVYEVKKAFLFGRYTNIFRTLGELKFGFGCITFFIPKGATDN